MLIDYGLATPIVDESPVNRWTIDTRILNLIVRFAKLDRTNYWQEVTMFKNLCRLFLKQAHALPEQSEVREEIFEDIAFAAGNDLISALEIESFAEDIQSEPSDFAICEARAVILD